MKAAARSRRDRIRAQLADLKMPGALEAIDDVLTGVDGGGVTASEAIEQLLGAQITLRNNRRLQAAMRSSRLPGIKTLDDFDFSFTAGPLAERLWRALANILRAATTPVALGLHLSWRVVVVFALGAGAFAWSARARPWPAPGANPLLDLVAAVDPLGHGAIRAWYLGLAGVMALTGAWRVWIQGGGLRGGRRGLLPPWPSADPTGPRLVVGELHHPTAPREIERPGWLTIPERGLYTGIAIFGAVGTGKTSACMHPFARQLFSWNADNSTRRAAGLVLEVKGDFCYKYGSMIANIVPCSPVVFRKACYYNVIRRILAVFTGSLLCRYVPYCTIVYPSICDTQVGYTTCVNDRLRPPSWRE